MARAERRRGAGRARPRLSLHLHRPRGRGVAARIDAGIRNRAKGRPGRALIIRPAHAVDIHRDRTTHRRNHDETQRNVDRRRSHRRGWRCDAGGDDAIEPGAGASASADARPRRAARSTESSRTRRSGSRRNLPRRRSADRNNQPDGSEVETARQLARDLGVELEVVQVTGPQRIPALLAGRADVAISSLSITFDRAKTIMFAPPHGALSIVIAGPKKTQIRKAADMAGKKIGLTRATLEEATVPASRRRGPAWSCSTTWRRRCRR